MGEVLQQGDVLKIEKIKFPVLITSKDFFNQTGEIIGCPIFMHGEEGPLHIKIETDQISGIVHCEKMKLVDLNVRGFSKISRISLSDRMNIADAIQGIFDYV